MAGMANMNTLNIVEDDSCCAAKLRGALFADAELRAPWYCPKCGTAWQPEENVTRANLYPPNGMQIVRVWQPIVECAVIRP